MSIVSVQIRHKCLPVLPWNIIGAFSEACTLLELFTAIKNGTLEPAHIFQKIKKKKKCFPHHFLQQ